MTGLKPAHVLALALVTSLAALTHASAAPTVVPADHPAFRYEGRFDMADPTAPVVIWQGSRITAAFEGDVLELKFDDVKGQVFLDVTIDNTTQRLDLREGQCKRATRFIGLGAGPHQLLIFKRSEAAAGTARFRGIEVAAGAQVQAAPAPRYAMRMIFFGDSITVGANTEDGAEDQWDDRSTHNNAVSYGALTAAAFAADYRNIAVSGMGICEGYVPFTAAQIWDRVYPTPESARADLGTWIPDVVFLNYGENDDSFTKNENRPFPPAFARAFVALVRDIRATWPKAQIVILRGGMFGGARSERLREPWRAAVTELQQSDPRITTFVFTHWTDHHPRAKDHRIMADELIAWLRKQPFMAP